MKERLMHMFNKIYTKIKKLFDIKIIVEPKTKKKIEFRSRIPEYTKWVIPINFCKNEHNKKPL